MPSRATTPMHPSRVWKASVQPSRNTKSISTRYVMVGLNVTTAQGCAEGKYVPQGGTQCQELPAKNGPKYFVAGHHKAPVVRYHSHAHWPASVSPEKQFCGRAGPEYTGSDALAASRVAGTALITTSITAHQTVDQVLL